MTIKDCYNVFQEKEELCAEGSSKLSMQKKDCRHREQLEACAGEKLTPICRGETEAKARDLAHQEAVSSMTRNDDEFLKWRAVACTTCTTKLLGWT